MTAFPLPPNATIGLVGGGQLGRMSALAAARLGYRCHILTRETDSPAAQVSHGVTLSDYTDPDSLRAFAAAVDVISFEFENVSAEGLDLLASLKPVRPAPAVLRVSQDRIVEKSFVNGRGIATAPWRPVATLAELEAAVAALGLPSVLKTTREGYDGKGQAMLRDPADLAPAFARLHPKPLILEGFIDYAQEISVVVGRGADGTLSAFDTVENRHRDHILDLTLAPARVAVAVSDAAQAIAREIAAGLDLIGLLAVEMFVDAEGRVLVNEIAPRPHNSGHWTLDACPMSQFELHIRAVAGLPLPPATRHADAVMKNLVGAGGGGAVAPRPGHAGLRAASVRQGGGAAGAQDGARHPAVSQGVAAGGFRDRGRAGVPREAGVIRFSDGTSCRMMGRERGSHGFARIKGTEGTERSGTVPVSNQRPGPFRNGFARDYARRPRSHAKRPNPLGRSVRAPTRGRFHPAPCQSVPLIPEIRVNPFRVPSSGTTAATGANRPVRAPLPRPGGRATLPPQPPAWADRFPR